MPGERYDTPRVRLPGGSTANLYWLIVKVSIVSIEVVSTSDMVVALDIAVLVRTVFKLCKLFRTTADLMWQFEHQTTVVVTWSKFMRTEKHLSPDIYGILQSLRYPFRAPLLVHREVFRKRTKPLDGSGASQTTLG